MDRRMAQVTWTEQVINDLYTVFLFIARDAPGYAELMIERVFAATERLGEFLRSGRIVPEIGQDEIREVIVQNYRIMYRVLPGELEILTVRHGARQVR